MAFLFLLLGGVFALRAPVGTPVVKVNEPDTVVGDVPEAKSAAATGTTNEEQIEEEHVPGTDGFRELFNGRDLTGWQWSEYRSRIRDNPFSVKHGGILSCTGHPAGTLRTMTTFEDYVLRFEWRAPAGSSECRCEIWVRTKGRGNYIKLLVGQECTGDLCPHRSSRLADDESLEAMVRAVERH